MFRPGPVTGVILIVGKPSILPLPLPPFPPMTMLVMTTPSESLLSSIFVDESAAADAADAAADVAAFCCCNCCWCSAALTISCC